MTLIPKRLRLAKAGFSLLEVVISISIIGILSSIAIPTYQFFIKEKNNLNVEQEALMIKDDLLTYMATYQNGSSGFEYPIIGQSSSSSNGTNGVCNITSSQLVSFSQGLANNASVLNFATNRNGYEYEMGTSFTSGVMRCTVTLNFKDKKRIIFEYDIHDNSLNYRDLGYLRGFTYYSSDGVSCYITM